MLIPTEKQMLYVCKFYLCISIDDFMWLSFVKQHPLVPLLDVVRILPQKYGIEEKQSALHQVLETGEPQLKLDIVLFRCTGQFGHLFHALAQTKLFELSVGVEHLSKVTNSGYLNVKDVC